MSMFVILPLISFILLFLVLYRKNSCWRSVGLLSSLVWGILLTTITETLSFFNLLSFGWLLSLWTLSGVVLGFLHLKNLKKRNGVNNGKEQFKEYSTSENSKNILLVEPRLRILLLGMFFIISIIGLIALIAPPNTNDSMGYHMPRVMHWIQNHSVAHFPTNYTAQLFLPPWSAFAILHLQVLSGGDRYANLVQWFSMVGSITGVSLIAKHLGANIYGQTFAAVFCATIPMGILQGSSTQNDYVVAFWLVCLVYYVLRTLQERTKKTYFLQIGISLGLAIFTKPTAYLYSFPFLVWLFVSEVKLLRWQVWKPISQVAFPSLLVNALHFARNFEMFHNPLGTSPTYIIYTNRAFSIPIFLSNIIRNIALHLSTPSPSINRFLVNFWSAIHSILNVDINDPRTSSSDFQLNSLINHEDLAGNSVHLLLIVILIACFSLGSKRKIPSNFALQNYLVCIITGFLLFCLILAWTPFHTRLHLTLFVLSSAFVGCVLSALWQPKLVSAVAGILIILSFPWVFFNENRPVIANSHFLKTGEIENIFNTERIELYFMGRRYLKYPMIGAANFIKTRQCLNVGVSFDRLDIYEYPLWALLQENNNEPYRIEHIGVDNVSNMKYELYPFKSFSPCIIYATHPPDLEKKLIQEDTYIQQWFFSPVSVLQPS
jgi:4-amino-4-deoxy-L-arabinose transferase-like glycosyltransferase